MTRIPKNNVRFMVIKQNLYNWIRITLVCLQKLELSCASISLLVLTRISRKGRLPLVVGLVSTIIYMYGTKDVFEEKKKKQNDTNNSSQIKHLFAPI